MVSMVGFLAMVAALMRGFKQLAYCPNNPEKGHEAIR